jgi:hypothetical protein
MFITLIKAMELIKEQCVSICVFSTRGQIKIVVGSGQNKQHGENTF